MLKKILTASKQKGKPSRNLTTLEALNALHLPFETVSGLTRKAKLLDMSVEGLIVKTLNEVALYEA